MKVTIDDDGLGFETETAHYTHDGHFGKTEGELKADVAEMVRILSLHSGVDSAPAPVCPACKTTSKMMKHKDGNWYCHGTHAID